MKHEVEDMVRSGHSTHAQERNAPEPSGEDEPGADRARDGTLTGGVPDGMTQEEVDCRSEPARHLPPSAFPATAERLRAFAAGYQAPASVLGQLDRLPADRVFRNVGELWEALGGGREERP